VVSDTSRADLSGRWRWRQLARILRQPICRCARGLELRSRPARSRTAGSRRRCPAPAVALDQPLGTSTSRRELRRRGRAAVHRSGGARSDRTPRCGARSRSPGLAFDGSAKYSRWTRCLVDQHRRWREGPLRIGQDHPSRGLVSDTAALENVDDHVGDEAPRCSGRR